MLLLDHPFSLSVCILKRLQHVCADTLRSISVLIAAGISTAFPVISGALSDSVAAIAVSIIILVSLVPLIQGLIITAIDLYCLRRDFGDMLR